MIGGGLNLHNIARGAITAVNSFITVAYQASTGTAPDEFFKQVPTYAPTVSVKAQMQPMTYKDLMQVDGLNLNGTKRAFYLYGSANGVVRVAAKGGDLITDSDKNVWLVAMNLEQWPFWCKVACTLQNGS